MLVVFLPLVVSLARNFVPNWVSVPRTIFNMASSVQLTVEALFCFAVGFFWIEYTDVSVI